MSATIETIGYPRAALVGNPSDDFYGRTIAFTINNFTARTRLTTATDVSIVSADNEVVRFDSVDEMISNI